VHLEGISNYLAIVAGMNKVILSAGFILLFVLSLQAKEVQSALEYLNAQRQKSGLVKFKANMILNKAARSHAAYLVRQQKHGHYEKKGWKGYTGKTPTDRVLKAGYACKAVMENVTENAKNYQHSIDILFAAVYHRFVFLNFDYNEIGIGTASTKKKKKVTSAYVYMTGSSELKKLCQQSHTMIPNTYYIQDLCRKTKRMTPVDLYEQKVKKVRKKNKRVILYPYPDAKEILPVFYTENPHPLPGSKVSGYPVTVQFNPLFYKEVKLKKFTLFDKKGKKIKKFKILTHENDQNHRFKKLQFAYMPLKRLEYGMTYRVKFEAVADGKRIKISWRFTTKKLKAKLYKITKKKTLIKAKSGEKIALYFEPVSDQDVLDCVRYADKLQLTCLDRNTILLRLPRNKFLYEKYTVETDKRSVIIVIE